MPARKSARRTRSKKFRDCSSRDKSSCKRKKTCSYRRNRSPRCQPKRSRSRRRSSKKLRRVSRKADKNLGALLSESEVVDRINRHRCSTGEGRTKGELCAEGCSYDMRLGCIPTAFADDKIGKFLADGKRFFTFRSNKKPAFSFKIALSMETLMGDYAGAIRFSPLTGRLVLCYGPMVDVQKGTKSKRPLLATIVRDSLARNLWDWYQNNGRHLQKRRAEEMVDAEGNYYYAEIYGLPGASIQLSWQEAMWLDKFLDAKFKRSDTEADKYVGPKSLNELAMPPSRCPGVLEKHEVGPEDIEQGCFAPGELGEKGKKYSVNRVERIKNLLSGDPIRQEAMLDDFDPFQSGGLSRRERIRSRFGFDGLSMEELRNLDMDIFDDIDLDDLDEDDPRTIQMLLRRVRGKKGRSEERGRRKPVPAMGSPSFATFTPSNVNEPSGTPAQQSFNTLGGGAALGMVRDARLDKRLVDKHLPRTTEKAKAIQKALEDYLTANTGSAIPANTTCFDELVDAATYKTFRDGAGTTYNRAEYTAREALQTAAAAGQPQNIPSLAEVMEFYFHQLSKKDDPPAAGTSKRQYTDSEGIVGLKDDGNYQNGSYARPSHANKAKLLQEMGDSLDNNTRAGGQSNVRKVEQIVNGQGVPVGKVYIELLRRFYTSLKHELMGRGPAFFSGGTPPFIQKPLPTSRAEQSLSRRRGLYRGTNDSESESESSDSE